MEENASNFEKEREVGGSMEEYSVGEEVKMEIAAHPMCEELLAAHVACLRVGTPVDQQPLVDSQYLRAHHLLGSYHQQWIRLRRSHLPPENHELHFFMSQYLMALSSFGDLLRQNVRVHAVEAAMACREIELSLHALTGITVGEGSGATMSEEEEDEDEKQMCYAEIGEEMEGLGPLAPTESERSLMERVRKELKSELKQGFRSRIKDVREEILRKRRAGKLPGNTTSVLKNWWQHHSKWPYPTEDDKVKLVEETGLHMKQINNWFINQRKRNWHNHTHSSSSVVSKRRG